MSEIIDRFFSDTLFGTDCTNVDAVQSVAALASSRDSILDGRGGRR